MPVYDFVFKEGGSGWLTIILGMEKFHFDQCTIIGHLCTRIFLFFLCRTGAYYFNEYILNISCTRVLALAAETRTIYRNVFFFLHNILYVLAVALFFFFCFILSYLLSLFGVNYRHRRGKRYTRYPLFTVKTVVLRHNHNERHTAHRHCTYTVVRHRRRPCRILLWYIYYIPYIIMVKTT